MAVKKKKPSRKQLEAKLIAKAWHDDAFCKRLMKSPDATLKKEGLELPEGVKVKVVQNTAKLIHLVIPAKPAFKATKGKRPKTPSRVGPTMTFG